LTLFLYGALSVGTFFLSLNLIQVQGYNPALAGFAFVPFTILLAALSRWTGAWADRFDARGPLVVGPAIVGLAFLLMSPVGLTRGPAEYWISFFPGVVTLGVGMGITVAPLTTAVLGAVAREHAGIASGINNAVSRTAGVLSIALVGALALFLFATAVDTRTAPINLSAPARKALAAEANRLGEASVPSRVSPAEVGPVQTAIKLAFVDTFRVVMFACATLAWVSALLAAWFLRNAKA
jgi:MFS family permease